jgi:hypothetical protein
MLRERWKRSSVYLIALTLSHATFLSFLTQITQLVHGAMSTTSYGMDKLSLRKVKLTLYSTGKKTR